MKACYSIDGGPQTATQDTKLLAALTAMGVPLGTPPCLPTFDEHGRERWQYNLGLETIDGKFTTRQLIGFWADENFVARNPDHPFAYICACLKNYRSLQDAIKQIRPLAQVRKGRSIALIHVDAPDRTQELILGGLR
jgi:hypothetical protein